MVAKRKDVDPYLPAPGWKPKSAFWQAMMRKVEYNETHRSLTIPCPACGGTIELYLTTDADPNRPK